MKGIAMDCYTIESQEQMTTEKEKRVIRHRRGDEPVTNDDLDEALRIHSEEERRHYNALISQVMDAFPDGDLAAHRQYHSSKIEAAKAEKEFWMAAKQELMRRGISGILHLLGLIALLAVAGAAAKYGIALPFVSRGP